MASGNGKDCLDHDCRKHPDPNDPACNHGADGCTVFTRATCPTCGSGDPGRRLLMKAWPPPVLGPRVECTNRYHDCFVWERTTNRPGGYGIRWRNGKIGYVHRQAWEDVHGPIPDGFNVLHRCDNPPCIKVAHLFLGTQQANVDDMVAKGRHRNQKTHCKRGHEFTTANTYIHPPTGKRACRECSRARQRARSGK